MANKKPLAVDDQAKQRSIASIKRYFKEELDVEVGDLKASLILDYFVTEHGPTIYNQAIADARAFFDERSADLAAVCYRPEFPFWERTKKGR